MLAAKEDILQLLVGPGYLEAGAQRLLNHQYLIEICGRRSASAPPLSSIR
jgi:hypothetical protein